MTGRGTQSEDAARRFRCRYKGLAITLCIGVEVAALSGRTNQHGSAVASGRTFWGCRLADLGGSRGPVCFGPGREPTRAVARGLCMYRNFHVTLTVMTAPSKTGADRYFARRAEEPGYAAAYDEARRRIDAVDRLMRTLDERRETLGLSKAELARRAELTPEVVRRLFSVDDPNPTISTLTALADTLDLDLVPTLRRAS